MKVTRNQLLRQPNTSIMKAFLLLLFACSFCTGTAAQSNITDSLEAKMAITKPDINKVSLLLVASAEYTYTNPKKATHYAEEAILLSNSLHNDTARVRGMNALAFSLFVVGNYSTAMKIALQSLALAGKENYTRGIASTYSIIGNIYRRQGSYKNAIAYLWNAKTLAETLQIKPFLANTLSTLGMTYLDNRQTDSAMYYLQAAYQLAVEVKTPDLSLFYNRMGDLQYELQNPTLALEYYRLASATALKTGNSRWLCLNYVSVASVFKKEAQLDSSIAYARQALVLGQNRFLQQQLQASTILSDVYAKQNHSDSSLKYLRLSLAIKDSMQNNQEEADIQNLLFEERVQKKEVEEEVATAKEERNRNLQYAAIALGLVGFLIAFLLFSHSVLANQRVIRFLGVLSLLVLFEFINLLLHPYVGNLTHHSPVLMLLFMVCLAALLIPLHHKLEHWITHKMVAKNNRIRLAAAKRTIAQLEEKQTKVL